MKIGILGTVVLLCCAVAFNALGQTAGTAVTSKPVAVTGTAGDKWVCPMHADVVAAASGKCVKCGMALTKAHAGSAVTPAMKHGAAVECGGKAAGACKKTLEAKKAEKKGCGGCCEGNGAEGCAKECAKQGEGGCPGKQ